MSRKEDISALEQIIRLKISEDKTKREVADLCTAELNDLIDLLCNWLSAERQGFVEPINRFIISPEGKEAIKKRLECSTKSWEILRGLALINVNDSKAIEQIRSKALQFVLEYDPQKDTLLPSAVIYAEWELAREKKERGKEKET